MTIHSNIIVVCFTPDDGLGGKAKARFSGNVPRGKTEYADTWPPFAGNLGFGYWFENTTLDRVLHQGLYWTVRATVGPTRSARFTHEGDVHHAHIKVEPNQQFMLTKEFVHTDSLGRDWDVYFVSTDGDLHLNGSYELKAEGYYHFDVWAKTQMAQDSTMLRDACIAHAISKGH